MKLVKLALGLMLAAGICVFSSCSKQALPQLRMTVFKVGKADAIVLASQGCTVLVDAGEEDDGEEIVAFLRKKGIETIDCFIVTHFDKDHIGGADTVLRQMEVKQVYQPDYVQTSKQYKQYQTALRETASPVTTLREDCSFQMGSCMYTIYAPQRKDYKSDNEYSLVISVSHGANSFLLAGDAMGQRLLELKNVSKHTILKVPHHGVYDVGNEAFFQSVGAEYAIITCSDKKPEDKRTVDALQKLKTQVYLTREGNITAVSDGVSVRIEQ